MQLIHIWPSFKKARAAMILACTLFSMELGCEAYLNQLNIFQRHNIPKTVQECTNDFHRKMDLCIDPLQQLLRIIPSKIYTHKFWTSIFHDYFCLKYEETLLCLHKALEACDNNDTLQILQTRLNVPWIPGINVFCGINVNASKAILQGQENIQINAVTPGVYSRKANREHLLYRATTSAHSSHGMILTGLLTPTSNSNNPTTAEKDQSVHYNGGSYSNKIIMPTDIKGKHNLNSLHSRTVVRLLQTIKSKEENVVNMDISSNVNAPFLMDVLYLYFKNLWWPS
ncbi:hypothetical protein CHS0354_034228 [Potamilus streckersoni]|uniref:Uncharacterized protein n=1 Tax=Potamilus streckersoni TaxID=2493646 RepID=A0AAE0W696_9BIVA|nr:hypothetical protein CHS0354_034228 [Potamilus streckersoni]